MKEKINNDLKEAMKEKNQLKLASIKAIKQSMTDFEKSNPGKDLTEEIFAGLIDSLIKSRNKSVEAYVTGNRQDLADIERAEIEFIKTYLPERIDERELRAIALELKSELGFTDLKEMGKMISILKERLGVKAKPADISKIVKEILS